MLPLSSVIFNDSIRSCKASFHLKAIVRVDVKLTCCNEIIEATAECKFCRTSLTFVFHHFHLRFSLVSKRGLHSSNM